MTTHAFIGSGTLLEAKNTGVSPSVFVAIGEVVSISPVGTASDRIEITHVDDIVREFTYGMSESQPIDIVCNYDPSDNGQTLLAAVAAGRDQVQLRYTLPAEVNSIYFLFNVIVLVVMVGPTTPNVASQIKFSATLTGGIIGPLPQDD